MRHPLDGVNVVDLAAYIAGAYCSSLLADMGAQVIKVESHTGDGFRTMGGAFQGWNRGKRAIILNLQTQEGRDILYKMVADADVVTENYRPGVAKRLGADYETLKQVNPGIIYCSVVGYGLSGPYSSKPAFDPLLQAQSGAMAAQGGEGNPPMYHRIAMSDYSGSMLAAFGIASALYRRARTGQGQHIETSLVNSCIATQAAEFLSYLGKQPSPRVDSLGRSSTYRLYEASDGWFFLSCSDDDSWARLCAALNRSDLVEKYPDMPASEGHDAEIGPILEEMFRTESRDHWLWRLRAANIRCTEVRYGRDAHRDPQAIHLGLTADIASPDAGPIKQMGIPIRFSRTPGVIQGPSPALGQHTDEVLSEMGYTSEEVAGLRERGVVG
jgi:crotonobetainyl-CoA:carnitine CoA-transferase CaiB-like acyl-CoA transferase